MGGKGRQAWYELRPYRTTDTGDDAVAEANMRKILNHLDKFLLVLSRGDDAVVRIHVRASDGHRTALDDLEGMEVLRCAPVVVDGGGDGGKGKGKGDGSDNDQSGILLAGYARYAKYATMRHCAVPLIPKTVEKVSMYRLLAGEMSGRACVALYARKTAAVPHPIGSYIAALDGGRSPEGIGGMLSAWFSAERKTPSARQREKMQDARQKLATGNLFVCRMVTCAASPGDERAIRGAFPSLAFRPRAIGQGAARRLAAGRISLPMFGASRSLVLSDEEIMSFMSMPNNKDIDTVGFDLGRMASHAAGLRGGEIT